MSEVVFVPRDQLEASVLGALLKADADEPSAVAATRAMMHASYLGIDSHGVRLASHYAEVMKAGRVNPKPKFQITRTAAATAMLDADDGLGHAAAYAGMDLACAIARESGIAMQLGGASRTAELLAATAVRMEEPIASDVRAKALEQVDKTLVAAGLLEAVGRGVSKEAVERLSWERESCVPTAGIVVKGCIDECDICEPEVHKRIELDLARKELENELLKKQVELLEKSQEYRCCPEGSAENGGGES
jgi:hypothetical protein